MRRFGWGIALLAGLLPGFGRAAEKPAPPAAAGQTLQGNLAVIEIKLFELSLGGAERRLLVRSLVENQTATDLAGPFVVEHFNTRNRMPLGSCRGEELPAHQVAVCDLWVRAEAVDEGESVEAVLNRRVPGFGAWDRAPVDDGQVATLRTIPEEGQKLAIHRWDIDPLVLTGAGEVGFRFSVEGAHLVWLLIPGKAPRLLAGHPADGTLSGEGRAQVQESGSLTLAARNSLGAFVYRNLPVVLTGVRETLRTESARLPEEGRVEARVLDPGDFDVPDEDGPVLDTLRAVLAADDLAARWKRLKGIVKPGEPVQAKDPQPRPRPSR